jgi:hypothetical protein
VWKLCLRYCRDICTGRLQQVDEGELAPLVEQTIYVPRQERDAWFGPDVIPAGRFGTSITCMCSMIGMTMGSVRRMTMSCRCCMITTKRT